MLSRSNGITPEQWKNLQEITDKMKETKDAGQAKEHFFYDQQFHNELVALSNNKRLIKAHDEILLQLTRMRFLSFLENSLQSKACMKHQAIIDAIKAQDYERGRQASLITCVHHGMIRLICSATGCRLIPFVCCVILQEVLKRIQKRMNKKRP
mgnify:CR=1 FL=1